MIYITGDTHGCFGRIVEFCEKVGTTKKDIMIVLGDAGVNYYLNKQDDMLKEMLCKLPITFFFIHGNHEERPFNICTYRETEFMGGIVYHEEFYPGLYFAKDGEVYDLGGKKTIVIGGAYSVDKQHRIGRGLKWFESEQPSDEIKAYVERSLDKLGWEVDVVLSHTTPEKYEPVEMFMSCFNRDLVDSSTEQWLDKIEEKLTYKKWYAGHFHTDKKVDKLQIMLNNIEEY